MKIDKNKKIFLTGTIIATIFIVILGYFYINAIKKELEKETVTYLSEIVEQSATLINTEINGKLGELEAVAIMIEESGNYNPSDILREILPLVEKEKFKRMGIILPNGDAQTTDGYNMNLGQRGYFQEAMAGKSVISDSVLDLMGAKENRPELINVYATPVYKGETVLFTLFASIKTEELMKLLEVKTFNDQGYSFILNATGDTVVKSFHNNSIGNFDNLFDVLKESKLESDESFSEIKEEMQNGEKGEFTYTYQGVKRYANFKPIEKNDWIVVSVVPEKVVKVHASEIIKMTIFVVVTYFIIIGALFFLILRGRRGVEKQLEKLAFTDEVTKSKNWHRFKFEARELLEESPHTLVLLDIDRFRFINSAYGNQVGNEILLIISQLLEELTEKDELTARVSGDNFAFLAKGLESDEDSQRKISWFNKRLNEEKAKLNITEKLNCHFGIYFIEDPLEDIDKAKEKANLARIEAKNTEGVEYYIYSEKLNEAIIFEKKIEGKMEDALKNGNLIMYLQPKYDLHTDSFCGAEALVRWKDPEEGMIFPDEFIPIFEKTGFITKLDMFMFEEACKVLKSWKEKEYPLLKISVNISRKNLSIPNFIPQILALSEKYDIEKNDLELELTESCVFDNVELMIETGKILRTHGFQISMDDFGSGYSSVSLLETLPLDTIKLDKGFFTEDIHKKKRLILIKSIIKLVKELEMVALAEGIETEEEVAVLRELGCDVIQGYYFGKPMPLDEFEEKVFKDKMKIK